MKMTLTLDEIHTVPDEIAMEYESMVARLFKQMGSNESTFEHALVGMEGEAGELVDAFKKEWVYNRERDREHLVEELGDYLFYTVAAFIYYEHNTETPFEVLKTMGEMLDYPPKYYINNVNCRATKELQFSRWLCRVVSDIDLAIIFNHPYKISEHLSEALHAFRLLLTILDISLKEVLEANMYKLEKADNARYKNGYSDEAAQARRDKNEAH